MRTIAEGTAEDGTTTVGSAVGSTLGWALGAAVVLVDGSAVAAARGVSLRARSVTAAAAATSVITAITAAASTAPRWRRTTGFADEAAAELVVLRELGVQDLDSDALAGAVPLHPAAEGSVG